MDCATLSVPEAAKVLGIGRVRMYEAVRIGRVWGVRGNVAFVLARESLPAPQAGRENGSRSPRAAATAHLTGSDAICYSCAESYLKWNVLHRTIASL